MATSIKTERLLLRPWSNKDIEQYALYYQDERNAKYVGGQKDREQAWRSLATLIGHWSLNGFGYFAVEEKSTALFVGCIGVWKSPAWPELELGYWLSPTQQHKGYAVEAGARCIEFAKKTIKAKSLVSYIAPSNTASKKVATKLGARYEKTIALHTHGPHCVYRYY